MNMKVAALPHPSGDKRFKMLDAAMKRQQYQPDSLLGNPPHCPRTVWVLGGPSSYLRRANP